tara:strand:- start:176 stop:301 length:126 start_codon:yes stop_codon:yes gene_type:complete
MLKIPAVIFGSASALILYFVGFEMMALSTLIGALIVLLFLK